MARKKKKAVEVAEDLDEREELEIEEELQEEEPQPAMPSTKLNGKGKDEWIPIESEDDLLEYQEQGILVGYNPKKKIVLLNK